MEKPYKKEHNNCWRCRFCGKVRNTLRSIQRHYTNHVRISRLYEL